MSNEDVENYKQIKSDLDELRLLVEKSELWVFKGKPQGTNISQTLGLKKRKSKLPFQHDNTENMKDDCRLESTQVLVLIFMNLIQQFFKT